VSTKRGWQRGFKPAPRRSRSWVLFGQLRFALKCGEPPRICRRSAAGLPCTAVVKWEEAGLLKASVLKPVLATLERSLVLRKLGRLEEEDRRALREVLWAILGE